MESSLSKSGTLLALGCCSWMLIGMCPLHFLLQPPSLHCRWVCFWPFLSRKTHHCSSLLHFSLMFLLATLFNSQSSGTQPKRVCDHLCPHPLVMHLPTGKDYCRLLRVVEPTNGLSHKGKKRYSNSNSLGRRIWCIRQLENYVPFPSIC